MGNHRPPSPTHAACSTLEVLPRQRQETGNSPKTQATQVSEANFFGGEGAGVHPVHVLWVWLHQLGREYVGY